VPLHGQSRLPPPGRTGPRARPASSMAERGRPLQAARVRPMGAPRSSLESPCARHALRRGRPGDRGWPVRRASRPRERVDGGRPRGEAPPDPSSPLPPGAGAGDVRSHARLALDTPEARRRAMDPPRLHPRPSRRKDPAALLRRPRPRRADEHPRLRPCARQLLLQPGEHPARPRGGRAGVLSRDRRRAVRESRAAPGRFCGGSRVVHAVEEHRPRPPVRGSSGWGTLPFPASSRTSAGSPETRGSHSSPARTCRTTSSWTC